MDFANVTTDDLAKKLISESGMDVDPIQSITGESIETVTFASNGRYAGILAVERDEQGRVTSVAYQGRYSGLVPKGGRPGSEIRLSALIEYSSSNVPPVRVFRRDGWKTKFLEISKSDNGTVVTGSDTYTGAERSLPSPMPNCTC